MNETNLYNTCKVTFVMVFQMISVRETTSETLTPIICSVIDILAGWVHSFLVFFLKTPERLNLNFLPVIDILSRLFLAFLAVFLNITSDLVNLTLYVVNLVSETHKSFVMPHTYVFIFIYIFIFIFICSIDFCYTRNPQY